MNNYLKTRLYAATFENLSGDNRMFRAYSDFRAVKRAMKISGEHNYGKVLRIYEIHPRTLKIIRGVFA